MSATFAIEQMSVEKNAVLNIKDCITIALQNSPQIKKHVTITDLQEVISELLNPNTFRHSASGRVIILPITEMTDALLIQIFIPQKQVLISFYLTSAKQTPI